MPSGPVDLATDLVGHWRMDDGSGNTVTDDTGNYDGTRVNDAAWTDGYIGGGMSFDGSGDCIELSHVPEVNSTPFTMAGWIKINQLPSTKGSHLSIFEQNETGNKGFDFALNYPNNRLFYDDYGTSCSTQDTYAQSNYVFSSSDIGQWRHVAMTFAPDGKIKFYINGQLDNTDTGNVTALCQATTETAIGCYHNVSGGGGHGWPMDGVIDEAYIYNRVLSDDEVKALALCSAPPGSMKYDMSYNVMSYCNGVEWVAMGPVGGTPPTNGLVGHWKLDETSGTSANDSTGNGNNGTMQGGLDAGSRLPSPARSAMRSLSTERPMRSAQQTAIP